MSAGGRGGPPLDPRILSAVEPILARGGVVVAPTESVARALAAAGFEVEHTALEGVRDSDAVALLADELDAVEPEGLIAAAAEALRPGGQVAVTARNAVFAAAVRGAAPSATAPGHRDDELVRVLGHRGFALELLAAPGAAAALRGEPAGPFEPALDRLPALLGAAPRLVAVGRLGGDARARSAEFFATLPRKVVAAAVLCRDDGGRVLVVHDTFKREWTIPGGVVDADEDPRSGAVRESWEEAGVRVLVGDLLGVFASTWPDRLIFVYAATPATDEPPRPVHAHEIDMARWVTLADALDMVSPRIRMQVERCLSAPGGTWRE